MSLIDIMPQNRAAWIEEVNASSFVVKDAPYTPPSEGQVVIENAAVAINPADHKMQDFGAMMPHIQYPTIFGIDIAGVVEEVGPGVTRVKKGDRVTGYVSVFLSFIER
jgi:NADPH:quinone reductase-like Zn-dependent oxidoreductase